MSARVIFIWKHTQFHYLYIYFLLSLLFLLLQSLLVSSLTRSKQTSSIDFPRPRRDRFPSSVHVVSRSYTWSWEEEKSCGRNVCDAVYPRAGYYFLPLVALNRFWLRPPNISQGLSLTLQRPWISANLSRKTTWLYKLQGSIVCISRSVTNPRPRWYNDTMLFVAMLSVISG